MSLRQTEMAAEHLGEQGIHYPHIGVGVQLTALTQELPDFPREVHLLSFETVKHCTAGKKKGGKNSKEQTRRYQ